MLVGAFHRLVSIYFTGNTRLPMVAGWDHLLPAWFTRFQPRYKTPVNSILFVAIVTLVFAIGSLIGVGPQEAFQLIDNAAGSLRDRLPCLVRDPDLRFESARICARRFGSRSPPLPAL